MKHWSLHEFKAEHGGFSNFNRSSARTEMSWASTVILNLPSVRKMFISIRVVGPGRM